MDASHPQGEPAAAAGVWVTVEEWSGSSGSALSRTAVLTASASTLTSHRFGSRWGRIGGRLLGAFVPEGFPGSVTPDYVPFQVWDTLQGLSTYIRAMLSTQALLGAIGVGEQSATVIGATFQWFLRDLTGMLGGILFTFYQGSNLDSNAKMWRLVADFMNDLGMLMDLVSPLFPSSLIFIMCLGSISRSFTGVASGATRAALTQHFALANNAADISAKEGSQETLATMLGMGLGMLLAHITRGHALSVWASFLSLTMFHMYANYKAVQSLSLTTLNNERASILLQYFIEHGEALAPQQVSQQEHILPFWSSWRKLIRIKLPHERVHLGAKASMLTHNDMLDIAKTRSYYKNANYFLLDKEDNVHVFIHKQATSADCLKSFIHGLVLVRSMQKGRSHHAEACQWMDEKYSTFISKAVLPLLESRRPLALGKQKAVGARQRDALLGVRLRHRPPMKQSVAARSAGERRRHAVEHAPTLNSSACPRSAIEQVFYSSGFVSSRATCMKWLGGSAKKQSNSTMPTSHRGVCMKWLFSVSIFVFVSCYIAE